MLFLDIQVLALGGHHRKAAIENKELVEFFERTKNEDIRKRKWTFKVSLCVYCLIITLFV